MYYNNLEIVRKSRKLTQLQLSKKVGITRAAYINIEKSKSIPKLDTVLKICRALNCSVEQIFHL